MNLESSAAIYVILWWVVLFTVLPMGVVSYAEAGLKTPGGGDPGAPVDPKLLRKFITTTWVTAVIFAPFWLACYFHWISLGMLRNFG